MSVGKGWGRWGRKSYLGLAEVASFCSCRAIKTPKTTSTNTHVFIHFPHHISKDNCGATGIIPQKPREMTIPITF